MIDFNLLMILCLGLNGYNNLIYEITYIINLQKQLTYIFLPYYIDKI